LIDPFIIVVSLQYGLLYVLMSLGLTMAYSIARFANFAQGEYVMIGAYVAAFIFNVWHISYLLMIPVAGLVGSFVAVVSYLVFYRPMMRRGLSSNAIMIGSIGVMLIYEYIIWIFSEIYNNLFAPKFDPKRLPAAVEGVDILYLIIIISIASVVLLAYVYGATSIGRASRAYADNPMLARISGVSETKVMLFMWSVAGFLGGLGGALWGAYASQVTPDMGFNNLLRMFATTILGGMTSFYGTVAAGLIVGFAENMGIYALNQAFGVPTVYKPVIPFAIIITTLLIYPQGLGGISLRNIRIFVKSFSTKS